MDKSYFFDRFVMRRNYREIILALDGGDKKIKELADHSGMAYQHLSSVLQEAQKEGIITSKKKDHSLNFNLTRKGEIIKELCVGLKVCIENWDEDKSVDVIIGIFNRLDFIKEQKEKKEDPEHPKGSGAQAVIKEPTKRGNEDGNKPGTVTE